VIGPFEKHPTAVSLLSGATTLLLVVEPDSREA
jgi:hypothetical protein